MTPAPISVERLREVVAIVNGPLLSCKANDHAAWEAVSFLQDQGLALLHQLAELEAEVERLNRSRAEYAGEIGDLQVQLLDASTRAEAAERAREEACKLLQECEGNLYHPHAPSQISALEDRIAAFLAASGGK